jgi:putative ABC transport system ATP-binding protein
MIKCSELHKTYPLGKGAGYQALRGVSFHIKPGEFAAITGPSGCGKSTLMNLLGFLDVPSAGKYFFDGRDVSAFGDYERSALRLNSIGFVFQSFNLLPRFSALDNVKLPMLYAGVDKEAAAERAAELLARVGLAGKEAHSPIKMSGGERQRVGLARALANRPRLLLADEPTGNLDSRSGVSIMDLLLELNRGGLTIVMVTHDQSLARLAGRTIRMKDGLVEAA